MYYLVVFRALVEMKYWIKLSYLFLVYLFLYFPIATLVLYSFNAASFTTQWHGFTFKWYQNVFTDYHLIKVTLNSVVLGLTTASLATSLGTLAAISLYRYRFLGRQWVYLFNFILIISPEIVMAISFLFFFSWMKFQFGFWTLLFAHTTFCMPYVTLTVYSRLANIDPNILKAAKDLGASEARIFLKILLPMIRSSLLAGWLLSFTLSLDDVMISFFLSGSEFAVLPLEVYSWVRLGVKPELNALCSVLLGLTLILVVTSQVLSNNETKTR